jgi:ankyrin repeat protein
MHVAATEGHEVIIKVLVEEYDANIHCLNEEGATPLHLAALFGHVECVRLLLNYGASIDARDMVLSLSPFFLPPNDCRKVDQLTILRV